MMTFEEYLQQEKAVKKEDEMVAAAPAPASDVVSPSTGTTAADVLGPCDHNHSGGFMSKDCNHLPKPMMLEPIRRYKKSKKRKRKLYQFAVNEADDASMLKKFQKLTDDQICSLVDKQFGISFYDIHEVISAAWCHETREIYLKLSVYEDKGDFKTRFVTFKIDGSKFAASGKVMDKKEAKSSFKKKENGKHFALSMMFGSV